MALSSRPAAEIFIRALPELPENADQDKLIQRSKKIEAIVVGITTDLLRRYIVNRRETSWNSYTQYGKDFVNTATDKLFGKKVFKEIPRERLDLCYRLITDFKNAKLDLKKWCDIFVTIADAAFAAQSDTTVASQSLFYYTSYAIIDVVRTIFILDPILKEQQYDPLIAELLTKIDDDEKEINRLRRFPGGDVTHLVNARDAKLLTLVRLRHEDTIFDKATDYKLLVRATDYRTANQFAFPDEPNKALRNGNTGNYNIPIVHQAEFFITYFMDELETDAALRISAETYLRGGHFLPEIPQEKTYNTKSTTLNSVLSFAGSVISTVTTARSNSGELNAAAGNNTASTEASSSSSSDPKPNPPSQAPGPHSFFAFDEPSNAADRNLDNSQEAMKPSL